MLKRSYIVACVAVLMSVAPLYPSSDHNKKPGKSGAQQEPQQFSYLSLGHEWANRCAKALSPVVDSTASESESVSRKDINFTVECNDDGDKKERVARAEAPSTPLSQRIWDRLTGAFVTRSQSGDGDKKAWRALEEEDESFLLLQQCQDLFDKTDLSPQRIVKFDLLEAQIKSGTADGVDQAFEPFKDKSLSELEMIDLWGYARYRCGDATGIAERFWNNASPSLDSKLKKRILERELDGVHKNKTANLPVANFVVERMQLEAPGEFNSYYEKFITDRSLRPLLLSLLNKQWIHFERSELEKKLRAAAHDPNKVNEFNLLYDYLGKPHNSCIDHSGKSLFQVALDRKNYELIARLRKDGATITDAIGHIKAAISSHDQSMLRAVTESPAGGDKALHDYLPKLLLGAAKCGNKDAVKLFLERGVLVEKCSKPTEHPLIMAVVDAACEQTKQMIKKPDYVGVMNVLLAQGGFTVENEDGLPWWVELGKERYQKLLQACSRLFETSNKHGHTPLTSALISNRLETVQQVLELGVPLTISHTDAAWCYVVEHVQELSPDIVKCVYNHVKFEKNHSKIEAAFKAAVKTKSVDVVRGYLGQQDAFGLSNSLIQQEFRGVRSNHPCKKILEEHLKKSQASKPLSPSAGSERKREVEQEEIETKQNRASATSIATGSVIEQSAAQSQRAQEQQASQLAHAVKDGKHQEATQLLNKGAAVTGDVVALALDNAQMLKIILPKVKDTPGFSLNKLLKDAVMRGKVNALEELITQGADVHQRSEDGTLIMMAATAQCSEAKRKKMIEILLKRRVDINACDENGLPWWLAPGKEAERKLLVDCGASLDAYNKQGETLLVTAAAQGNVERVTRLLDEGASVDRGARNKTTPLLAALRAGHSAVVTVLLAHQASVEKADAWLYVVENAQKLSKEVVEQLYACVDAQTKLEHFKAAVTNENIKFVKACLAQQDALGIPDVLIKDIAKSFLQKHQRSGLKALFEEYLYKKAQQAKQVVHEQPESFSDVESIEGPSGQDYEIEAKESSAAQVVLANEQALPVAVVSVEDQQQALLDAAARQSSQMLQNTLQSRTDRSPIEQLRAAKRVQPRVAELLKRELNVNKGQPLIHAIKQNRIDDARLLVAHRAYVDACDQDGNSALQHAVGLGNTEAVAMLLQNNASSNTWNFAGDTPLHRAASTVMPETAQITDMLLQHGASLEVSNQSQLDPVTVAASHNNWGFIERAGWYTQGPGIRNKSLQIAPLVSFLAQALLKLQKG